MDHRSMSFPVMHAAGVLVRIENRLKFWLTGGELTNRERIFLTGPTKATVMYDIQNDEWEESVDLGIALAGHCTVKVSTKVISI